MYANPGMLYIIYIAKVSNENREEKCKEKPHTKSKMIVQKSWQFVF